MASTNKPHNKLQAGWVSLLHILLLLVLAVVATWSMWQAPALVAGHSARKDLARLVEFDAAMRAGDVFPAWSPDLYAGYGSPIFQFYAPLAYYATELPVLMGFNYATAFKVTWLLTLFASGLAMYRLGSTYLSAWAACLGSVFYMVAPYRLVDMFIRHALAEHCAFMWLPLIVWGTARFAINLSRVGFSVGAIASAALILTHNVTALIGLPVCVVVALAFALSAEDGRLKPATKSWALAGVVPLIGVGLAAFFLVACDHRTRPHIRRRKSYWRVLRFSPALCTSLAIYRYALEFWYQRRRYWKGDVSTNWPASSLSRARGSRYGGSGMARSWKSRSNTRCVERRRFVCGGYRRIHVQSLVAIGMATGASAEVCAVSMAVSWPRRVWIGDVRHGAR